MKRLILVSSAAAAIAAAAPALAQDGRRQVSRPPCPEAGQCVERRGAFPWLYLGQDEGVRRARPMVRRLALPG